MKKFFEGLSLSSIVAGTLAAVTSFLLASKIGIAGSVIGAAASYVVSTVAANIYKNVLISSSEKLQAVGGGSSDDAEQDDTAKADDDKTSAHDAAANDPMTADGMTARRTLPQTAAHSNPDTIGRTIEGTAMSSERRPRSIRSVRSPHTHEQVYSVKERRWCRAIFQTQYGAQHGNYHADFRITCRDRNRRHCYAVHPGTRYRHRGARFDDAVQFTGAT